jgi:AcrR family transcriptional regulator
MARPARAGAHDALLDAARDEFARRGLAAARVEDIARRAGISKGAFYLHFRTKEDAFREIVQRFLGALEDHACRRQEVEDRIRLEPGDDAGALSRRLDVECAIDADLLELLWRNRHILAAVDGASGKRYRDLVGVFRRRMRALVARRMVDRQSAGRLRPEIDPAVVGDIVVGTYEDFARRMIDMKEKPDLAAWARSLLLVLYGGILEPPAAPRPPAGPAHRRRV